MITIVIKDELNVTERFKISFEAFLWCALSTFLSFPFARPPLNLRVLVPSILLFFPLHNPGCGVSALFCHFHDFFFFVENISCLPWVR